MQMSRLLTVQQQHDNIACYAIKNDNTAFIQRSAVSGSLG